MNTKDKTNTVMDAPDFYSSEHYKKFLLEQLEEYKKVKEGDSTWKEFDIWRQGKGYTPTNPDSLRRSWQQLGVYLDHGLVGEKEASSPLPTTSTVKTSTNFSTGESTSEKTITLKDEDLTSPRSLLVAHGFDPNKFEIKTVTNTEVSRHTERMLTGEEVTTHTVNSRVVVKPREGINFGEVVDYFKDFVPTFITPQNNFNSDDILVVPAYDLHFGRRTYNGYEGEEYNINEEKNRIIEHYKKYLTRFSNRRFKEVYLILGQDLLNSCFTGYTSSQSHLQDNGTDVHTMAKKALELLIELINMFKTLCNSVKVVGNYGNHAVFEDYMLLMAVNAFYANDNSIIVDFSPEQRKYITYGKNLIGVSHGDKEGKRINTLMQTEAKESWGMTDTHIWILGHLHHFSVSEENGVTIYRVPTIVRNDKWTYQMGYASECKTMAFIFDENELIETHTFKERD